jgi:hypothetical protein
VLRGETASLDWLMGCRVGESAEVETWLESFLSLPLDHSIARKTVLRQRHDQKVPDAIILATATELDGAILLP